MNNNGKIKIGLKTKNTHRDSNDEIMKPQWQRLDYYCRLLVLLMAWPVHPDCVVYCFMQMEFKSLSTRFVLGEWSSVSILPVP